MNPPYEQNLERDAKLVAAGFRGTLKFFEVAKAMGLWTTPQEAVNYARNIREQPQAYRYKVGELASQLLALADAAAPKKKPVGRRR